MDPQKNRASARFFVQALLAQELNKKFITSPSFTT
jgi:hypothetical protein